jgi:type VI secretion system protein VasJ
MAHRHADAIRRRSGPPQPVQSDRRFRHWRDHFEAETPIDRGGWSTLVDDCVGLLSEVGVNLRVLDWITRGLWVVERFAGVGAALQIWTDTLAPEVWEGVEPASPEVRTRMVAASLNLLARNIAATDPSPSWGADAAACADLVPELDERLLARLEADAPSIEALLNAIRSHAVVVAAPKPAQAQPVEAIAPTCAATPDRESDRSADRASAAPAPAARRALEQDEPSLLPAQPVVVAVAAPSGDLAGSLEAMLDSFQAVLAVAELARRDAATAAQPWVYRLPRDWRWAESPQPRPDQGSRTPIPPPAADHLESLHDEDPLRRLEAAERAWPTRVCWLDPHRHAAEALVRLGRTAAAEAVRVVTLELVVRLRQPDVLGHDLTALQFDDGTPFADDATKAWLREPTTRPAAPRLVAAVPVVRGDAGALPEDLEEAIVFADAYGRTGATPRDRFALGVALARRLITAERWGEAQALATSLDRVAVEDRLEVWDPSLAADAAELALLTLGRAVALTSERATSQLDELNRRCTRLGRLGGVVAAR